MAGKVTYRYLVYSILEQIKQTFDDAEMKRSTIIFWTQVEVNRILKERLSKRKLQSGEYLSHFTDIPVLVDGIRKYVEMPSAIVDLDNDNGIHLVTYLLTDFDWCDSAMDVPFTKTSPAKLWALRAIPITKPRPDSPYMAREGSKLYLYGIENVSVDSIDMWIYTSVNPTHLVDLDTEVEISPDQASIIIYRVLALVKFSLVLPSDKLNDGADTTTAANNKTAISQMQLQQPNQPNQPNQEPTE